MRRQRGGTNQQKAIIRNKRRKPFRFPLNNTIVVCRIPHFPAFTSLEETRELPGCLICTNNNNASSSPAQSQVDMVCDGMIKRGAAGIKRAIAPLTDDAGALRFRE